MSFKYLLYSLMNVYSTVIIVYVLMSWIPMNPTGVVADIYRVLGKICDPYLDLFKKLIPPIGGMVDVTPIIALLVLQFGVTFILRLF